MHLATQFLSRFKFHFGFMEKDMKLAFVTFSMIGFAVSMAVPASGETPLTGMFVAHQACPAVQSIQSGTNPGAVGVEPNRSYPLLAKNKPDASYYLIDISGAEPSHRWVAVTCGERMVSADSGSPSGADQPRGSSENGGRARSSTPAYVFSVSWQPAFCEQKRDKAECQSETPDRFDASHFTLHGLWPQPASNIYCNVSPDFVAADKNDDWDQLPAPKIADSTRKGLEEVMPGTMSLLERHEWIKHGTCFQGETADAYFSRAIALIGQLNGSKVRDLFAAHIGSEISGTEIKAAFDSSFGEGAGDRVRVSCKKTEGRNLIIELTIGLVGEIDDNPSLQDLIAASEPTNSGCPLGIVDPVSAR
jgi:ribonuclease T2